MSCRSTPLSSAATSYAKQYSQYFSDTQIQSLYHATKGSIEISSTDEPDSDSYAAGIEELSFRVRHDEALSDSRRESLLRRLDLARAQAPVDARTWQAVAKLPGSVAVAQAQYEAILEKAGKAWGVEKAEVHKLIQEARGGSWGSSGTFDDYSDYPNQYRFDLIPGLPQDPATQKALRKVGYETFLAQPYPVFVYGTLRQGQGNNRVVADGAQSYTSGIVKGVGIYGAHRGFPYAAEHEDPTTITRGEIIDLRDDEKGAQARLGMDWLEGFYSNNPLQSHYERRLIMAESEKGVQPVWIYLARGSARSQLHETDRIIHGDWVKAKNEYRDPSYIRSRLLGL